MLFDRTYEHAIGNSKSLCDAAIDLWNGGNVLAGGVGDNQTVFKKPVGYIVAVMVFFVSYASLLNAYAHALFEKVFGWAGKVVLYFIRAIFGVLAVILCTPFLFVMLFIDPATGENTKLGKLVTKYEKNTDKA